MTARPGQLAYELLGGATFALAVLTLFFVLVGRPFWVEGSSMEPTLTGGELLLVRSVAYAPRQGDVVVLRPEGFDEHTVVKRVIALGGQQVSVDYAAGVVLVDGSPLEEPYVDQAMIRQSFQSIEALTVPDGCIFVMGDNRNASFDSRDPDFGPVDSRMVVGQALAVLFPLYGLRLLS